MEVPLLCCSRVECNDLRHAGARPSHYKTAPRPGSRVGPLRESIEYRLDVLAEIIGRWSTWRYRLSARVTGVEPYDPALTSTSTQVSEATAKMGCLCRFENRTQRILNQYSKDMEPYSIDKDHVRSVTSITVQRGLCKKKRQPESIPDQHQTVRSVSMASGWPQTS